MLYARSEEERNQGLVRGNASIKYTLEGEDKVKITAEQLVQGGLHIEFQGVEESKGWFGIKRLNVIFSVASQEEGQEERILKLSETQFAKLHGIFENYATIFGASVCGGRMRRASLAGSDNTSRNQPAVTAAEAGLNEIKFG